MMGWRFRRHRRPRIYAMAVGLIASMLGVADGAATDNSGVRRVAFFGFQLINTSLEPITPIEAERVKMLDDLLRAQLDNSGRFQIVPIPASIKQQIDASPEISNCNGCERKFANAIGADWAAWGTVQKVSNLILNINLYLENVPGARLEFVKSVDIRGNTDESWRHGLNYMLRHYLFEEP
jgi:Protein of unknown function (DUF2380)